MAYCIVHKNSSGGVLNADDADCRFTDERDANDKVRAYLFHNDIYVGDTIAVVEE